MVRNTRDSGWISIAVMAISFGLPAVSCGGDTAASGGGGCAPVNGCGGDITGVWHLTSMCAQYGPEFLNSVDAGTSLPSQCDGMLGSPTTTPIDATITFTSDTYQEAGTVRFSTVATFTAACLGALHITDVAGFCSALQTQYQQTFDSASCSSSGGGCQCSVSLVEPFTSSGPYHVQGNELFFDTSATASPYCVSGNTASLSISERGASARMDLRR